MKILKRDKIVTIKKEDFVLKLANNLIKNLKLYCKKIQIVGSIRRKEPNPVDIDIVLIPKNLDYKKKIEEFMKKKGKFIQGGEHESTWKIEGVKIELYYTISKEWGATLLAYSSKIGSSIGLRVVAKRKGFKLNQHGLFKRGKLIAGKTEKDIYKALERSYKDPQER